LYQVMQFFRRIRFFLLHTETDTTLDITKTVTDKISSSCQSIVLEVEMSSRNVIVAASLIGFVGVGASFPFFYMRKQKEKHKNLMQQDAPLTGSQVIRGAYINTGTKDIGADPDWDWKNGTYKGRPLRLEASDQSENN